MDSYILIKNMNTSIKLTEDIASSIKANVKAMDFEVIEKVKKERSVNGTFDVIISTEDLDRAGEIVRQNGWDTANYKNNPIVLWGHDYHSLPVGVCTDIYQTTYHGMPATGARGVFLPSDINPYAQQVRKLYEFGMTKGMGVGCTTSVGFIPKEFDKDNNRVITKAELLEFSFVPIPANQGVGPAVGRAVTLEEAKELGLDTFALRAKGVEVEEKKKKEPKAGASCELDDGSPGILASDPKNQDGPLVCVPDTQDKGKKATSQSGDESNDNDATQDKFMKSINEEHGRHVGSYKKSIEEFKTAVEDQSNDPDEPSQKAISISKCMKDLRGSLADEHDMHRAKMIECFRSFKPSKEKAIDMSEHLKSVRDEHKAYTNTVNADLDKFEEKCKTITGDGDNSVENHTDWIVGKMAGTNTSHQKKIKKIAMKVCKDGFGEGEVTESKEWYEKGAVEEQLAEDEDRQAKWKKIEKVYDVFGAFIEAYLNDSTAVNDFEKLLDEAVSLMKGAEAKGVLSQIDVAGLSAIVFRVRIGINEHAATTELMGEAYKNLKAAMTVFENLQKDLDGGNGDESRSAGEGDDAGTGDGSHETGSKSHVLSSSDDGLKAHLLAREIVRGIAGVVRDQLEDLNAKIRTRPNPQIKNNKAK